MLEKAEAEPFVMSMGAAPKADIMSSSSSNEVNVVDMLMGVC